MRTFTKTLMAFALVGFLMTSCGGGSDLCGCADTMLAMMKEAKEADKDEAKAKAVEDKYKDKLEKCKKLGEGKSEDEKKKMEEELRNCPAYKKMEELMKPS